jgi:hypothetical protein
MNAAFADLGPCREALLDCAPVTTHAPTYAKLFALGIYGAALTGRSFFDALHVEAVGFLPGARFEFARDMRDASGHELAVIIPARGKAGDLIDLVAWSLDGGALATWRGVAAMLGEDMLTAPRIEIDGLHAFPGPLEWLRAGRQGVVILDADRARWRLVGERLVVADPAFGQRLRATLRLPEPRVFIQKERLAAA